MKGVKDRHDDRTTDRLLRRGLQGDPARDATPECVDPETLAAWMEGSLPAASLARAEQHASSCARCQAMLALMVRTTPGGESRPWWRTLTASWLVPVAAAATAFVLWVAVDRQRAEPPAAVRPPQLQQMEAPDPAAAAMANLPADERSKALEPKEQYSDRSANPLEPRLRAQPAPSPDGRAAARKAERRDAAIPDALDQRVAPRDRAGFMSSSPLASASTPQRDVEASAKAPVVPAPPPPVPAPASSSPAAAPSVSAPAALPQVADPNPRPLTESVGVARESARVLVQGAGAERVTPGHVEIVSSEPTFRWRILPPATIQRSTDGGATWTSQANGAPGLSFLSRTENAGPPRSLNAGSAPAREICWIVGSEGIVLLSSDGISWQRRPFPEPVNLTAVRAVDGKTAVVTAEGGRQFSTVDGGATWSKIP